jgi:hypothetical protein
MRKYISSELNGLAWEIKKKTGILWGEAFELSLELGSIPNTVLKNPNSILGHWGHVNARNLASHFWSLAKAYEEVSDFGRSITMKNAARYLYKTLDADDKNKMDLAHFVSEEGISTGVIRETLDYFAAANDARITRRSENLVMSGADDYRRHLKLPYWTLR